MAVRAVAAGQACEAALERLVRLGRGVPGDTPAAAFLRAAARQLEASRQSIAVGGPVGQHVLTRLAAAGTLLDDVAAMSARVPGRPAAGEETGDGLAVRVDGLGVRLETRESQRGGTEGTEPSAMG